MQTGVERGSGEQRHTGATKGSDESLHYVSRNRTMVQ
jgi:hypothetical protein